MQARPSELSPLTTEQSEALRRRVGVRLRAKRERRAQTCTRPDPPPRYDEAFFEFVAWLDAQG